MGILTAWISSYSTWVSQFGAVGWIFSGLFAGLAFALILVAASVFRLFWAKSSAYAKWKRDVDTINPMDTEFNRKRVLIADLADPINKRVKGKIFTNCDLIGPANLIFIGKGSISNVGFIDCDLIEIKPGAKIYNSIVFEDCTIEKCRIGKCTLLLDSLWTKEFQSIGSDYINYTTSEIQLLPKQKDIAAEKQP